MSDLENAKQSAYRFISSRMTRIAPNFKKGKAWRLDSKKLISHSITSLTPVEIRAENYLVAANAAKEANISGFAVPASTANQGLAFGVSSKDWIAFVRKLVVVAQRSEASFTITRTSKALTGSDKAIADSLEKLDSFLVFIPTTYSGSPIVVGRQYAVEIQKWISDDTGTLTATIANPVANQVDSGQPKVTVNSQAIAGSTYPPLNLPALTEVLFDVDIVYTWVDDSDREWMRRREQALGQSTGQVVSDGATDDRFRNRDELKYSLRSLHMYAPWVRKIWLVTDDQVPSWLDLSNPQIAVVSHKELWQDDPGLPTFNSHAIEAHLHRIDGLAEHYVYMNDDVMFTRLSTKNSFFTASGLPKASFTGPYLTGWETKDWEKSTTIAGKNIRKLLWPDFNKSVISRLMHTPHPLKKSLMAEVFEKYPDVLEHLHSSKFRDNSDHAPIALALHYAYLTGQATKSQIELGYCKTSQPNLGQALDHMLAYPERKEILCINDVEGDKARQKRSTKQTDRLLRKFLDRRFPVVAPWELS